MLEPYEGKLSRTVLRGEGGSNALDLPDTICLLTILHDNPLLLNGLFYKLASYPLDC